MGLFGNHWYNWIFIGVRWLFPAGSDIAGNIARWTPRSPDRGGRGYGSTFLGSAKPFPFSAPFFISIYADTLSNFNYIWLLSIYKKHHVDLVCVYINIYTYVCMYVYIYIYICMYIYIYMYICTYIYMHTIIHIYIYNYIHTYNHIYIPWGEGVTPGGVGWGGVQ